MAKAKTTQTKAAEPAISDDIWRGVSEAIKPLDRVAVAMEAKWGAGRLARLVPIDLAAKFGRAQDALNEAIASNKPDDVEKHAGAVMRGWIALDAAAEAAGAEVVPSRVWSLKHEGRAYTVVLDRGDVDKVARMNPQPGRVVTINELLVAWQWHNERTHGAVEAIKAAFPGAMMKAAKLKESVGDELTF